MPSANEINEIIKGYKDKVLTFEEASLSLVSLGLSADEVIKVLS